MNAPHYHLPTVLEEVVEMVSEEMAILVSYGYGYIEEANFKMITKKKYPFVWLLLPFKVKKEGDFSIYGTSFATLIIVNSSIRDSDSPGRFRKNYELLNSIKEKFLEHLNSHEAVNPVPSGLQEYEETFNPFWGERQKSVFDDIVDVLEISSLKIKINNNQNC